MRLPENPGRDFPFYNGQPISLTGGQWLLLLGLVAGSFALLIAPIAWPGGTFGAFVPAILFPLIPLKMVQISKPAEAKAPRLGKALKRGFCPAASMRSRPT